jgi:hypothetical protein
MLKPGQWALHREEALRVYEQLAEALVEVRRLRALLEEVTRRRRQPDSCRNERRQIGRLAQRHVSGSSEWFAPLAVT